MELGVDALQIGRGLLFSRNCFWIRSRSLSRRKRLLHHCRLLDLGFEMVIDGLGKLGGDDEIGRASCRERVIGYV